MATNPPPDRPTEPLYRGRPAPSVERTVPVAERPVIEERVVAPAVDPNVILLRLEDAIDALRTWLVVVGVVAIAALGVALYAVLADNNTSSSAGSRSGLASDARVSQLETRVDRISRQVQDLRSSGASGGDTAALTSRIDQLETTVKSLSSQSAGGTQTAIDELSSRIDALSKDVQQLKQSQTTTP
jgi:polyhydroxyalkanoate synthesis regulator phasin